MKRKIYEQNGDKKWKLASTDSALLRFEVGDQGCEGDKWPLEGELLSYWSAAEVNQLQNLPEKMMQQIQWRIQTFS